MPCAEGNYCAENQCSPKTRRRQQCSQNIECVSAYCANGYCCTSGTCCDRDLDCTGTFDRPAECANPSECHGFRIESVCVSHVCGEALIDDDSACTGTSIANECGPYPALSCNGAVVQEAPLCAATCSDNLPCDDGFRCETGLCIQDLNLENGTPCSRGADCQSNNCQNGLCCITGECCQTATDCSAYPGTALHCSNPSICEGTGTNVICENFQCRSVEINDDSVCDSRIVANLCGLYESVTCDGQTVQTAPQCLTQCEQNTQCDEGARCRDGLCQIISLQGKAKHAKTIWTVAVSIAKMDSAATLETVVAMPRIVQNGYSMPLECTDATRCDGGFGQAVCGSDSVCRTTQIADDRACNGQVANTCGYYHAVLCGNNEEQTAPDCPTSCSSNADCVAGAHYNASTCQPDLPNGSACDANDDCESGHCRNGFCCAEGDCCAAPRDCPSSYQEVAECRDAATCQGNRRDVVCQANQCASVLVPDDSGCTALTVAQICFAYLDARCNGQREQLTPRCLSSCTTDNDCKPAFECDRGECRPASEPCPIDMICNPR